jgi:enoyl-CoA hydratase/carnithine racemase
MALTGKKFDPKLALENGLVEKLAPMEKLYDECLNLARSIK